MPLSHHTVIYGMYNSNRYKDMVRRRIEFYASLQNVMSSDVKKAVDNITHAPKVSKTLSRAGWMLFWIPEPTMISTALGVPMILAGKVLSRYYNDLTVKGLLEETGKLLKGVEEFRYNLNDR